MNLKKIISQGESETVEFKKSPSESKEIIKSTLLMSKDEYERIILEKHKDNLYFDSQICKEAALADIGKEKIKWFLDPTIPYNPLIFRQFYRVGFVEDVGGGTTDIIEWCKKAGLLEPEFEQRMGFIF